jgi:hypothetical protein
VSSTVLGRASGCRLTIHADAAVTVGVVLANRLGLGPGGAEQEEGETLHHVDEEVLCVVLLGQPTGARRALTRKSPSQVKKSRAVLYQNLLLRAWLHGGNPSTSKKVRPRIHRKGQQLTHMSHQQQGGAKLLPKLRSAGRRRGAWREEEPWWRAMVGPRTSPEGNITAVAGAKYVRARVTKLSGTGMPHWP